MSTRQPHPTELLSAHLDGELQAAESAHVEEHLGGCRACTALLDDLRHMAEMHARESIPPVPADLADKIRHRLDLAADRPEKREVPLGAVLPLPSSGRRRRPSWMGVPLAAAASFAAAAVIWTVWQAGSDDALWRSPESAPATAAVPKASSAASATSAAPEVSKAVSATSAAPDVSQALKDSDGMPVQTEAVRREGELSSTKQKVSGPVGGVRSELAGINPEIDRNRAAKKEAVALSTMDAAEKAPGPGQPADAPVRAFAARKKLEALGYLASPPVQVGPSTSTFADTSTAAGSIAARGLQERTHSPESEQAALAPAADKSRSSLVLGDTRREPVPRDDADAEKLDVGTRDRVAAMVDEQLRAGADAAEFTLPPALRAMLAPRAASGAENQRAHAAADLSGVELAITSDDRVAPGREADEARRGAAAALSPAPSQPFMTLNLRGETHPGRALLLRTQGATLLVDERGPVMMSTDESVCFALLPANAGDSGGAGRHTGDDRTADTKGADVGAAEDGAHLGTTRGQNFKIAGPADRQDAPAESAPDERAAGASEAMSMFARPALPTALRAELDALFTRAASLVASRGAAQRAGASTGTPKERTESAGAGRTLWLQEEDRSVDLLGQDTDAAGAQTIDEFSQRIEALLEAYYTMGAACAELSRRR